MLNKTVSNTQKSSVQFINRNIDEIDSGTEHNFISAKKALADTYVFYGEECEDGQYKVEGRIERVISERTGWAAIIIETDEGRNVSAAGTIITPHKNARITLYGSWITKERFGRQLKVTKSEIDYSQMDKDSIISLLCSGFIKGIGVVKAEQLYKKFGNELLSVIENKPELLSTCPGIGKKTAQLISESYKVNKDFTDICLLLKPEATDNQIRTLYEKYADKTISTLKENPYIIIDDIIGIGFKKADKLAVQAMELDLHNPLRIDAAIVCGINEAGKQGHCFVYLDDLFEWVNIVVKTAQGGYFTEEEIKSRLKEGLKNNNLVIERIGEKFLIYTMKVWNAEQSVARYIYNLSNSKTAEYPIYTNEIEIGIQMAEKAHGNGFVFEDNQRRAVSTALQSRVSVITGGPGTGKTTIIKAILNAWSLKYGEDTVLLCAPTGRAALRMNEVTDYPAKTIHSSIQSRPARCEQNLLVIADESSMNDIHVAHMLCMLVSNGGRLVLVGDPDQLPSVGAGNFLTDIINSGVVPVVKLEVCYRNSGAIAQNADKVNHGFGIEHFLLDDSFQFVPSYEENLKNDLLENYYKLVDTYGIVNTACICPMRQRDKGKTNADDLNLIIRDRLNPLTQNNAGINGSIDNSKKSEMKGFIKFRINDRVMLVKNMSQTKQSNRSFVNGDMGFITDISSEEIYVTFDDNETMLISKQEFQTYFALAYALTVHKCQGQEYAAIVIPCAREHYHMLQRNLLYTGITRAKKHCIVVGSAQHVLIAAKTIKAEKRNTLLAERLTHPEWLKTSIDQS